MQYLIIGRDGTDEQALERRQAARPTHLEMCSKLCSEGKQLLAAALLDETGKMVGSVILADFESRQELDAWLEVEPYVVGKVWESIEVTRAQVAKSFESLFVGG
jgi:uncharacterized protein YciI